MYKEMLQKAEMQSNFVKAADLMRKSEEEKEREKDAKKKKKYWCIFDSNCI